MGGAAGRLGWPSGLAAVAAAVSAQGINPGDPAEGGHLLPGG
jgi:hypothetical protein